MAFTLTMTSPELLAVVGEKDPSRCVKDVMEERQVSRQLRSRGSEQARNPSTSYRICEFWVIRY